MSVGLYPDLALGSDRKWSRSVDAAGCPGPGHGLRRTAGCLRASGAELGICTVQSAASEGDCISIVHRTAAENVPARGEPSGSIM